MTRKALRIITLLGLLGVPALASAQTLTARVITNIPFEFTVNNITFPAGEYAVSRVDQVGQSMMLIEGRRLDSRRARRATFLTVGGSVVQPEDGMKLLFNRYGDEVFLAGLSMPGEKTEQLVKKGERERSLMASLRQPAAAGNSASVETKAEPVTVSVLTR